MTHWDDLRLLLAVSRTPTLSAAAHLVELDQTTLGRRLAALEKSLGSKLVHRSHAGASLTAVGRHVAEQAATMERAAARIDQAALGESEALQGRVVLATTEAFAQKLLLPALAPFCRRHPALELELRMANSLADLTKPDVDVAVRVSPTRTPSLITRRVATLQVGLYAPRGVTPKLGSLEAVVGYADELAKLPEAQWLATHLAGVKQPLRQASVLGTLEAVKAGVGAGLLPCFLADAEPGLQRVAAPGLPLEKGVWLVKNRQRVGVARVKVVWDFVLGLLEGERRRLAPL